MGNMMSNLTREERHDLAVERATTRLDDVKEPKKKVDKNMIDFVQIYQVFKKDAKIWRVVPMYVPVKEVKVWTKGQGTFVEKEDLKDLGINIL